MVNYNLKVLHYYFGKSTKYGDLLIRETCYNEKVSKNGNKSKRSNLI